MQALHDLFVDAQTQELQGGLWLAGWLPVYVSVLLGLVVASLFAPSGRDSLLRRGMVAMGPTLLGVVGAAFLFRLYLVATSAHPASWLGAWIADANLAVLGLILAWGQAMVFPLFAFGVTLWRRALPSRAGTPSPALGWLLIGAGVVAPFGLLMGLGAQIWPGRDVHVLLDAAALFPLTLFALGLWSLGRHSEQVREVEDDQVEQARTEWPDIWTRWKKLGALRDGEALETCPAQRTPALSGPIAAAWAATGGRGAHPQVLDHLADAWREPGKGWLVPDLPEPTEGLFVTASVLLAVREHGLPCLVVCPRPEEARRRLAEAIERSGSWPCGPLAAGQTELRNAFARQAMPAVAFVETSELSAEGIRALATEGRSWTRNIGLVVLAGVDRGSPLQVTHRLFTLRRLRLAMKGCRARWSVLACGFGGESTQRLLEQAFPQIRIRQADFQARSTPGLRVWIANPAFCTAKGEPWVKRAAEPLKQHYRVSIGDPGGNFGQRAIDLWGADLTLRRDVTFEGQASLAHLDEAWLVASYRALKNRVDAGDVRAHETLWGLVDNPVVRFLTNNDSLRTLHAARRLHPPRVLAGRENPAIARLHLDAALRDGPQDIPSLEEAFGKALVDRALGEFEPVQWRIRRHEGRLERVPLAQLQTRAATRLRETVTEDVVRVINADNREVLREVDRHCAETRYYPGCVFAIDERRFEVPSHSFDKKRGELLAAPVNRERVPTRPLLEIDVVGIQRDVEAPQQYTEKTLSFRMASWDATVEERVSGYIRSDGSVQRYDCPIVTRYPTRVRGLFFDRRIGEEALFHMARSFDAALVPHLFAQEEDVEVFPVPAGFQQGFGPGLVIIDRFVYGMGAAEALDYHVVREVLRWVVTILGKCSCGDGCSRCSPLEVMKRGPDKMGVLRALGR